jgi:hypothetical protein
MANITVLGGDIPSGKWAFSNGIMEGFTNSINLATSVKTVELQLAELADGVIAGGNKTEICFACELTNKQKFVAITDVKTYQIILGYSFNPKDIKSPLERYSPSEEILEIFKQQIAEVLDAEKTSCNLKRGQYGFLLILTLQNKVKIDRTHQVNSIKKAVEQTKFGGFVNIKIKKISPNITDDREWETSLLHKENGQVTILRKGQVELSLIVFFLIVFSICGYLIGVMNTAYQKTTNDIQEASDSLKSASEHFKKAGEALKKYNRDRGN